MLYGERNSRGRFLPGNKANPTGANGDRRKGWQKFAHRLNRIACTKTLADINYAIDEQRLQTLSSLDAAVYVALRKWIEGPTSPKAIARENKKLTDYLDGALG